MDDPRLQRIELSERQSRLLDEIIGAAIAETVHIMAAGYDLEPGEWGFDIAQRAFVRKGPT